MLASPSASGGKVCYAAGMNIETRWIIGTGVAIILAVIGAAAVVIAVLTAQLDEIRKEVGANAGPRLQPLSDLGLPASQGARAGSSFRIRLPFLPARSRAPLGLGQPCGSAHFEPNLVATYSSASSGPSRTVVGPVRT